MDLERQQEEISSIYQIAILGAEEILYQIGNQTWNESILLKNDDFLQNKKYQKVLLGSMQFFTPEEKTEIIIDELEKLFTPSAESAESEKGNLQVLFCRKGDKSNPWKIFLEIRKTPYEIPFEIHLISFPGHEIFPQKKIGVYEGRKEDFTYNMFPPEEYLALAFYEVIKDLELIIDMSWYKEIYETLRKESVVGRKVWESLNRLITEYPIPSLEKRLDTLAGYKDYGYMKKRWKSHSRRKRESYPRWEDVVALMVQFLTPVFEGVLKDEIFLGDWMPELGRYLD